MYDGMINVYKEAGYTSHDVVAKLRGILHQKKIGHTGTLDPDARGVLPFCLGKGTKLCDMITDHDKTYIAGIRFGLETDTQDLSGQVIGRSDRVITKDMLEEALPRFTGEIDQIPPMYSAIKVDGRKLYDLAREGKVIERKARRITIYRIRLLSSDFPEATIEVRCSKGTYIRTLCHDLGQVLGCGAVRSSLLRTQVGQFGLDSAMKLSEIQALSDESEEAVTEHVISLEDMLSQYPKIRTVDAEGDKLLLNGNPLSKQYVTGYDAPALKAEDGQWYRVYTTDGQLVGVYTYVKAMHRFKNIKMFLS